MLQIADRPLAAAILNTLATLQALIDAESNYPAKVAAAKAAWKFKTSTKAKAEAFKIVRDTLAKMCVGSVRCAYCEDSLADEVEHIRPKTLFPEHVFSWENYLFACGPCNGPKGNRFGIVNNALVSEYIRKPKDPVLPPPTGMHALINPRAEDPMNFLALDLGGTTPEGITIPGTFEFFPNDAASPEMVARAEFSIDILGLNREVMRAARENAYGGFRARLREYVDEKAGGADGGRLDALKADLLSTPHLTVFAEMRRQREYEPAVDALFRLAPEAAEWPLTSFDA